MRNVTQYGAIFSAAGANLNFDTKDSVLKVMSTEKNWAKRDIIDQALNDIDYYENTANYSDGVAAVFLADYIDDRPTPFSDEQRKNVLNELGIKDGDKFVAQYLATQKTNRSWHTSPTPNECVYFGEECTNRGTVSTPGKRGRKSTRSPNDFHRISSTGTIAREQLVTSGLEALYKSIPAEHLISTANGNISIDRLKSLPDDKLHEILEAIEQIKSERT